MYRVGGPESTAVASPSLRLRSGNLSRVVTPCTIADAYGIPGPDAPPTVIVRTRPASYPTEIPLFGKLSQVSDEGPPSTHGVRSPRTLWACSRESPSLIGSCQSPLGVHAKTRPANDNTATNRNLSDSSISINPPSLTPSESAQHPCTCERPLPPTVARARYSDTERTAPAWKSLNVASTRVVAVTRQSGYASDSSVLEYRAKARIPGLEDQRTQQQDQRRDDDEADDVEEDAVAHHLADRDEPGAVDDGVGRRRDRHHESHAGAQRGA